MPTTPTCLQCGEEDAKRPVHDPRFCSSYCARMWAEENAVENFHWSPTNQRWLPNRELGEMPEGEEELDDVTA